MPRLVGLDSGKVLQVKQTVLSANAATTATTAEHMEIFTGLNTSITPRSANSKILVEVDVNIGGNTSQYDIGLHLIKNATSTVGASAAETTSPLGGAYLTDSSGNLIRGDARGGNPRGVALLNNHFLYDRYNGSANAQTSVVTEYIITPVHISALDHPSTTSSITYHLALRHYNWSNTFYLNRTNGHLNGAGYDTNPVSTMTLTEFS